MHTTAVENRVKHGCGANSQEALSKLGIRRRPPCDVQKHQKRTGAEQQEESEAGLAL